MSTIVRHNRSGKRYVVIGAGFGAYSSMKSHWLFGDLAAEKQSGEITVIAVCDDRGRIGWVDSDDLEVVEVDGRAPADVLGTARGAG
jgi:hypothetical protein